MEILIKRIFLLLFFGSISLNMVGQGLVEGSLSVNTPLIHQREILKKKGALRSGSVYDTLSLPATGIKDDFSYDGPYPDTALWIDDKVYINNNFGKAPVTMGMATFDGLGADGLPYDWTVGPASSTKADYLTSKPIDLSSMLSTDTTLYLSFYYQPQGLGNAPETADSLVLEMKGIGAWKHVWSKKGTTLAAADSSWNLVMVPIRDTSLFKKGFQFRFYNYATVSGSLDHWSIDYIYLNRNRNVNDTSFEDISFVNELPSLLNNYTAMPWKHYSTSFMKTAYATTIRNNHTVVKNGSFSYQIFDATGAQVNTTYSGGSTNIDPYSSIGYLNYAPFTTPPLNYTIPTLSDTAVYTMQCIVNSTPDFNRQNDTIRHVQEFRYHYAYDDGTAETAFGLNVNNAMLAERFNLAMNDTLRYIDIAFNPVLIDASQFSFNLMVWTNAGGLPGTVVYLGSNNEHPGYLGTGLNGFFHYELETPLPMNPGIIYVGFIQNTNQLLNVGVDKNTNSQSNIFYNTSGTWNSSPIAGSVMIHPVFGSAADFVGVAEHSISKGFSVYPNPSSEELNLVFDPGFEGNSIEVMDLSGRKLMEYNSSNLHRLDVSGLSNGIYFLTVRSATTQSTRKFVISR